MKKLVLSIVTISLFATYAHCQVRLNKLLFITPAGEQLELITTEEKEVDEALPVDSFDIFKDSQKEKLMGFNGETFDMEEISVVEEATDESVIDTKSIFEEFLKEGQQATR